MGSNNKTASPTLNPCAPGFSLDPESIDERRKHLVRQTWRVVERGMDRKFTEAFYHRLFIKYPQVRPMFEKVTLEDQATKLYEVVCVAVRFLDNMTELVPVLEDLGRRHALGYGVIRDYYDVVNEVFIEVLYEYLQTWFSQQSTGSTSMFLIDLTDSWSWALSLISAVMADAGEKAVAGGKSPGRGAGSFKASFGRFHNFKKGA